MKLYKCLHCGRKLGGILPHKCNGNIRKRRLKIVKIKGDYMKVYVWENGSHEIAMLTKDVSDKKEKSIIVINNRGYDFIGTLDLDIKPEKKVVTREAKPVKSGFFGTDDCIQAWIPHNATNIKMTYDIEE